jgi:hypothetical protein
MKSLTRRHDAAVSPKTVFCNDYRLNGRRKTVTLGHYGDDGQLPSILPKVRWDDQLRPPAARLRNRETCW